MRPQADAAETFVQHHDGRRRIGPRSDHAVFEPRRAKVEKAVVGEHHGRRSADSSAAARDARPSPETACARRRYNAQQRGKTLLDGIAGCIDLTLRARVVGAPRLEDGDEIGHGRAVLRHGTEIALRHHPAHVLFRTRPDPHRVRTAQQQRVGLGIGNDAAGRRDHRRLMLGNDALERATLVAAEGCRARHLHEVGNAGAVIRLDAAVDLDERPAEVLREHAPERGFSRAAQPDQRDPPPAVGAARERDARFDHLRERRPFALRHLRDEIDDAAERGASAGDIRQQRRDRQVKRVRDHAQHADRRVAGAALDLREIAFGRLRSLRQLAPRHAALGALAPHLAPDRGKERLR